MKKRLVLKPFVVPTLYMLFAVFVISSLFLSISFNEEKDGITYVSGVIFDDYTPVISDKEKIVKPFNNDKVSKAYGFYSKDLKDEDQTNSIIVYGNTYTQNTGITYKSSEEFEINSIFDGEVIDVSKKELLGDTITIKHNKDIISTYGCLKDIAVKKGDKVLTNQVIAKSGICELFNKDNNLHFELYSGGSIVNPEEYFDKELQ